MIKKYKPKNTHLIEAVQWTGFNVSDMMELCGDSFIVRTRHLEDGYNASLYTDRGVIELSDNDYVIKDESGLYAYTDKFFEENYDEI